MSSNAKAKKRQRAAANRAQKDNAQKTAVKGAADKGMQHMPNNVLPAPPPAPPSPVQGTAHGSAAMPPLAKPLAQPLAPLAGVPNQPDTPLALPKPLAMADERPPALPELTSKKVNEETINVLREMVKTATMTMADAIGLTKDPRTMPMDIHEYVAASHRFLEGFENWAISVLNQLRYRSHRPMPEAKEGSLYPQHEPASFNPPKPSPSKMPAPAFSATDDVTQPGDHGNP